VSRSKRLSSGPLERLRDGGLADSAVPSFLPLGRTSTRIASWTWGTWDKTQGFALLMHLLTMRSDRSMRSPSRALGASQLEASSVGRLQEMSNYYCHRSGVRGSPGYASGRLAGPVRRERAGRRSIWHNHVISVLRPEAKLFGLRCLTIIGTEGPGSGRRHPAGVFWALGPCDKSINRFSRYLPSRRSLLLHRHAFPQDLGIDALVPAFLVG
jgi:hypothetical protein